MKKTFLLFILIIFSSLLGHLVGEFVSQFDSIAWLAKSYEVGLSNAEFDLKVLYFKLDFTLNICVAQIFMITIALFAYPKLSTKFSSEG